MDAQTIVNLALAALQAVLSLIAEIKGQSGLTDEEILSQAQKMTGANDALYNTLKAALSSNAALSADLTGPTS